MRTRALLTAFVAALAVNVAAPEHASAQFNPFGRHKPHPGAHPGARPAHRPVHRPKPKPHQKGPGADALIARYTGIVLAQPGAQFPLQRLAQLYRQRDGNLDKLVAEFESRAKKSGASQWNARVALAGIYKQDGDPEKAIATYKAAITERPKNPVAIMALAHLLQDQGDKKAARQRYEQALPYLKAAAEKEQTLRTLMQLSLDLKDFDAAKKFHNKLVARAKGSFYVRAELGRELLQRGDYQRAVDEYEKVVKASTGDNRVMAPALRDYGRALAKLGKTDKALSVLHRALRLAGGQTGVRREIYGIIVDVYRHEDKLSTFIAELVKQHPNDFERLRLLGNLYEETGHVDKALAAYQKALKRNAKDIGTRIKVVQLLQIQGELDQAIKQYEALIRAAPHNPDFVFQLAEALIQRGDRDKALAQLKQLEARSANDEETLTALADFYERVDEKDRALQVLKRLSKMGSDPRHLVELGNRYWDQGDKKKARATWARIKVMVPDRAKALDTLGEVYLEHDMSKEAIQALKQAMKLAPHNSKYKKAYALALERTGASASGREGRLRQYEEARRIWQELLKDAGQNEYLAREARQHIVTLWSLGGTLGQRVAPLKRRLDQKPPDLDAGRLLAEAEVRLHHYADAEHTLQKIVKNAPGDAPSLARLERVLVLQHKLREAIGVLHKLVKVEPKRAREYYQRMAQYAAELYKDEEAIKYAERAVELSPDDAEGHRKLGEMYRRHGDNKKAIDEFRQAISRNDRLFPVYFQLAELLLSQGKVDEADKLLRRVIRASPDEELVAQAARLSMQINLGKGTLESLEKELLPVALGNPQKPIYRRLLVEIYGAMAFPLVHQARSQDPAEAKQARAQLAKIGERAVKPLLDALGDDRDTQQRIAIELLAHIQNKSAGPALYVYATGSADPELRVRAMVAVGALRDPALLPRLGELLAPHGEVGSDESDPIAVAAAWAVARMGSPKARPLLDKLLQSEAPSIRALAALGLGLDGDKSAATRLANVVSSLEVGPLPRAAAAFALGQLGDHSRVETLAQLAEAQDSTVRAAAIVALARLNAGSAPRAIAEALVSPDPGLQRAGTAAALVLATGRYHAAHEPLEVPEGRVDVREQIDELRPGGYSPDDHARALIKLAPALRAASVAAVQSSPDRARAVADALLDRGGKPAFGPLTRKLDKVGPALQKRASQAATSIASAVVAPFVALASHPSPDVRARAVQFLATRHEPAAQKAVIEALSDPDERVQRAALAAASRARTPGAIGAVTDLLTDKSPWPVRVRAAEALGKLAAGTRNARAVQTLGQAARSDKYALVREAAVRALPRVDPAAARPVLTRVAAKDSEPRVQRAARELLASMKH